MLDAKTIQDDVARFLQEDVGTGDLTARIIPVQQTAKATVITREATLVCGLAWFDAVFKTLDPAITIEWQQAEGERAFSGGVLCYLSCSARPVLTGERAALYVFQTLSATASLAPQNAKASKGTKEVVLDTQNTIIESRWA